MQLAFFLAGEITQVKESIPWVRCASGFHTLPDRHYITLHNGVDARDTYTSKKVKMSWPNKFYSEKGQNPASQIFSSLILNLLQHIIS